jgi:TIR domain
VAQTDAQTDHYDIFISYSSKDRPWVEPFAKVLASLGWSVWWDRHIPTGQSFDSVIEQHLTTARCVVVVWSRSSVISDWVKTEAAAAKERRVLLPILIDDAKLPLEFNRVQTQFLKDWRVGGPHLGFDQLTRDIARLLKSPLREASKPIKPWWAGIHPL